jgi:hypothetical protein
MCASGMPHIVGNILMRLQLCFRPCYNRKSTQELMGPQRGENLNFGNFKTYDLGVPRQNDIWVQPPWPVTGNTMRGQGGGFPQVQVMVNLVSPCMHMVYLCTKSVPTMH